MNLPCALLLACCLLLAFPAAAAEPIIKGSPVPPGSCFTIYPSEVPPMGVNQDACVRFVLYPLGH